MASKAQKLLERMRQSKNSWKRADLDKLYEGFGFTIKHGGSHDIVKHPEHPQLRTTLPRHKTLAKGYVEQAVKLIDQLIEITKVSNHEPESNGTSDQTGETTVSS
ncbi:MAG: type II toxin-antitoxin system HicA family toxin [Chloroflexi bacterium]|nr:type II toxin-antitoxin system HicA family toxin [Chloroflexota bacterium]MBI5715539.1 type II toxin-antitoxin system HicA family toxin [Chloroflexota bacterium]